MKEHIAAVAMKKTLLPVPLTEMNAMSEEVMTSVSTIARKSGDCERPDAALGCITMETMR